MNLDDPKSKTLIILKIDNILILTWKLYSSELNNEIIIYSIRGKYLIKD